MEDLNRSTLDFEMEIKTLREKLDEANNEISKLRQEFRYANLSAEELIAKYDNQLRQKDELISQLEEQRNSNKQYKLAKDLEVKLQRAENYINQMAVETLNGRSDQRLRSQPRLSVLSTDMTAPAKRVPINKEVMDPQLLKNFEKLDELIQKNADEYDDDMVLDIENKERRKSSVDYPQLIDNLQNIVKDEERVRKEQEYELEEYKKNNAKLNNVVSALTKKLEEAEELKLSLMVEVDGLKNKVQTLIDEADRYKVEIERLTTKLTKVSQTTENSSLESTELRIRLEEIEDELSNVKMEKESLQRTLSSKTGEYETTVKELQEQLANKTNEIEELNEKYKTLLGKNKEYLEVIEKDREMKSAIEEQYKQRIENLEIEHEERVRQMSSQTYIEPQSLQIQPESQLMGLEIDEINLSNDGDDDLNIEPLPDSEFKIDDTCYKPGRSEVENSVVIRAQTIDPPKGELYQYIEEINQKNTEIHKLRRELIEANSQDKVSELENTIADLKLKLKHAKEDLTSAEIAHKKEVDFFKQNLDEMTQLYMNIKMQYTDIVSEKDNISMMLNRKIKKLNYQVQLYEEQITDFNRKVSFKK